MAEITPTGIVRTGLDAILESLRGGFSRIFGNDMSFDPETPQEQIVGIMGAAISEAEDATITAWQSLDITRSFGSQLDGHAALLGIARLGAQPTTLTVELLGVAGTLVPSGSKMKSDAGDFFKTSADAQIEATGKVEVVAESVEVGVYPVKPHELTFIVDVVPGWDSVDNYTDATPGREAETDPVFLRRYFESIFRNAQAPLMAIKAMVFEMPNVTDVAAAENDTHEFITLQEITIPPHSVCIVVEGGEDQDIAKAMWLTKTVGTGTTGDVVVAFQNPAGFEQDIKFYRVEYKPILVDFTIRIKSGLFPGNGIAMLKERIMEYLNGTFDGTGDKFEIDGIRIAEALDQYRLFTPINSVQGHTVTTLKVREKATGTEYATVPVRLDQKIIIESLDDITITVVT